MTSTRTQAHYNAPVSFITSQAYTTVIHSSTCMHQHNHHPLMKVTVPYAVRNRLEKFRAYHSLTIKLVPQWAHFSQPLLVGQFRQQVTEISLVGRTLNGCSASFGQQRAQCTRFPFPPATQYLLLAAQTTSQ